MKRKKFVANMISASLLFSMDGFSSIAHTMSETDPKQIDTSEFATFGAIHLNITNLKKSTSFWTEIVGMKLRSSSENQAEFGTKNKTLVVVHQAANSKFKKGFSGLYHFAIHAPNEEEFAQMLYRLMAKKYPYSPVDHTMSKSIYLDDPDGINVEFTLETPQRFKRVVTDNGFGMEDADGNIRNVSDQLDVNEVMSHLKHQDANRLISDDTYMGHIHLYANNVDASNKFYQKMGFIEFNNLPQYMYADVGAGGKYKHRIAMNAWHGINRPLAPFKNAGMKHYHIIFSNQGKLDLALQATPDYNEKNGGYWVTDPTGNSLFLTKS